MFKIEIDTDNAAFKEGDEDSYHSPALELARILSDVVSELEQGAMCETAPLYDANGNCVGHVTYTAD